MVVPLDKRPRSGPYSGINARSAKRFLTEQFKAAGLATPEEDARELVMAATGFDLTDFITRGTESLTPEQFDCVKSYADRRLMGEPVDHILGWREFYGRRFKVTKDVLSPRGDTEVLVHQALNSLKYIAAPKILDLGTGSGAIIVSLLADRAEAQGVAVDISPKALDIARQNAVKHDVASRCAFEKGAWFGPVTGKYDLIVSNPPYISDAAMESLEPEVAQYDPDISLRGGRDGLDPYHIIVGEASMYLKPNGWMWVEIGFDQGDAVQKMFQEAGFKGISVVKDLSGHDRCVGGQIRARHAAEI